jgi:hypothetical protein
MSVRKTPKTQTRPPRDYSSARGALEQAKAALWLLDQIFVGELGFLQRRPVVELPCWESTAACEDMEPLEVKDWLRAMATETLSTALAELDVEVRTLHARGALAEEIPATPATPATPAPARAATGGRR